MPALPPLRRSHLSTFARLAAAAFLGFSAAHLGRAAEPFRLDRIAIVRFTDVGNDQLWAQQAVLETNGRVTPRAGWLMARPPNVRPEALDRNLIETATWLSFRRLGAEATSGFSVLEGAVKTWIGDTDYFFIGANPDAPRGTGRVINLSTRARLAAGGDSIIAGFVIDERERLVLVRVIGPALRDFGVGDAAADPKLNLRRGDQTIYTNDNWSTDTHAADIARAAARVGAFALRADAKDAACLVRLPPGAYTVQAESSAPNGAGGSVLIEVYSVPDDGELDV